MSFKINSSYGSAGYQGLKNQSDLLDGLRKLSSGKQINRASDDASGMVVARRLSSQASGFSQAIQNAGDALSIVQTADAALGRIADLIQNIRTKAVQSGGIGQSVQSRKALQAEIDADLKTINAISQNTSFNGQPLLSGGFFNRSFQIGAASGQTVTIDIHDINPGALGSGPGAVLTDINVTTESGYGEAIQISDAALEQVNSQRSSLGADQNRIHTSIENLADARIQALSSVSQIQDLDYAEETINLNRIKLLSKAENFARTQANKAAGRLLDVFE